MIIKSSTFRNARTISSWKIKERHIAILKRVRQDFYIEWKNKNKSGYYDIGHAIITRAPRKEKYIPVEILGTNDANRRNKIVREFSTERETGSKIAFPNFFDTLQIRQHVQRINKNGHMRVGDGYRNGYGRGYRKLRLPDSFRYSFIDPCNAVRFTK